MTRKKDLDPSGYLFGLPVLPPEWQSRRNDARQQELEKTRALRAARLVAQACTEQSAAKPGLGKSSVTPGLRQDRFSRVRVAVTAATPPDRFEAGQTVMIAARRHEATPKGTFVIVRAVPTENGILQYRVRSNTDGHERIVSEAKLH